MNISTIIADAKNRIEKILSLYLSPSQTDPTKLLAAMRYSTLNQGKRLRPLLVYLTGQTFSAPLNSLDAPACAIELIHAYSLIHDDLPAMDNASLRRGQPTCHIAFGESTAILAGDALQPLAFEILANHPSPLSDKQRLDMIATLSRVSGAQGMALGQMLDLNGTDTLDEIVKMYQLKTGALLTASIELGAIAANTSMEYLQKFAANLSLAFQIQDDLLDIESQPEKLGKDTGIDQLNNKITFPIIAGADFSHKKVRQLIEEACDSLTFAGQQTNILSQFAKQLIERSN